MAQQDRHDEGRRFSRCTRALGEMHAVADHLAVRLGVVVALVFGHDEQPMAVFVQLDVEQHIGDLQSQGVVVHLLGCGAQRRPVEATLRTRLPRPSSPGTMRIPGFRDGLGLHLRQETSHSSSSGSDHSRRRVREPSRWSRPCPAAPAPRPTSPRLGPQTSSSLRVWARSRASAAARWSPSTARRRRRAPGRRRQRRVGRPTPLALQAPPRAAPSSCLRRWCATSTARRPEALCPCLPPSLRTPRARRGEGTAPARKADALAAGA